MTAQTGFPWYYHSPTWQRYRAGRLMYISARAEGIGMLTAAAIAAFEAIRPSPRIRIRVHTTAPRTPPVYLTKEAQTPTPSEISALQIAQVSVQAPSNS